MPRSKCPKLPASHAALPHFEAANGHVCIRTSTAAPIVHVAMAAGRVPLTALAVAVSRRYAPPMRGRGAGRVVLLVVAAVAFGALESVVKGNGAGVRDGVGNLSAP